MSIAYQETCLGLHDIKRNIDEAHLSVVKPIAVYVFEPGDYMVAAKNTQNSFYSVLEVNENQVFMTQTELTYKQILEVNKYWVLI
jgi:hypothetical protein